MQPETGSTAPETISLPTLAAEARRAMRRCSGDGPEDAAIVVLTDRPSWNDLADGRFLTDHSGRVFWDEMRLGAGLLRTRVRVEAICEEECDEWYLLPMEERTRHEASALDRLARLKPNIILALGDWPLEFLTGRKSADKYHLSLLENLRPGGPKVLSLLHPERVFREHDSKFYLRLGASRALRESRFPEIRRPIRNIITRPTAVEACRWLRRATRASWLSVDIETSQGQITCIGFATHPSEAISIPTRPSDWPSLSDFHMIWKYIALVLQGDAKKVLQNGIYDFSYLSAYGIRPNNFYWDTMLAQRVLFPEFASGLDNIARIYTEATYWKDDAKDWSARMDPDSLYLYNGRDVCETLAAAWAQRVELVKRGLMPFYRYIMEMASGPVLEMSWRGLKLDVAERDRLLKDAEVKSAELEKIINDESQRLLQRETNPRSPKQVKELLYAAGFKRLPLKDGKESSDKTALLKLQLRKPDSLLLKALIEVSEVNKEISSYLRTEISSDGCMHYTLYTLGTETQRMSCSKDPWDRGLNAQTLPSHLKSMFTTEAPDNVFVEVDLRQADARVVAWDSPDALLMEFFKTGRDIHRYVASQREIFNCAESAVTKDQRQLGKKIGHAENYGVESQTLAESCLKEMNLVISVQRAAEMQQGYRRTFPGVTRRKERIRNEIARTRVIYSPTGFHRHFNGRFAPDLFREAYAFLPQHLVAYAINQLILHVWRNRPTGVMIKLQVHDSALFEVPRSKLDELLALIKDQEAWNPIYQLAGGPLRIPIEIKVGERLHEVKEVFSG